MHVRHKANLGLTLGALAAVGLAAAPPAHADVVTFDDLTDNSNGNGTPIPNGYQGFNWTRFDFVNTPVLTSLFGPSGYANGTVSSPNVAFNSFGTPASFTTLSSQFTFNSAYFTAATNNNLTVTVQGLNSVNTVIDSTSFVIKTSGPTLETFNWSGLSTVNISTAGGTQRYFGGGTAVAIDDLTVNAVVTPESSGLANLSGGLLALCTAGLVLSLRRRRAKPVA